MTRYDVIIIGTGAGGGTLALRLAPTGKRILLLERGDYVPREKDNWSSRAVNVEAKYHTKEVWHTADGHELHPHTNYYVGGNTKFFGSALFRLRERDFGELPQQAASRRHGLSVTTRSSRTTPRRSVSITCMASAAWIRRIRLRAARTPIQPSATSRECSSCTTTLSGWGDSRSTCRWGSGSTSRSPHTSPCIRCETCDGYACLVHAKSDAEVAASSRRCSTRTSRCSPTRSSGASRPARLAEK